ncbi:MAG: ribbon-helix-helix protein, CopG family [Chloroflexota bacterium]
MRTTVNVEDRLLEDVKALAQQSGKTVTSVIEDALRERLARRPNQAAAESTSLPTVGGHGLLSGVDLDDSASLLDLMHAAS